MSNRHKHWQSVGERDSLGERFKALLEWAQKKGLSSQEIADELGISEAYVRVVKRKHGIDPKNRDEAVGLTKKVLHDLYVVRGWSIDRIAEDHGVSYGTVRKALLRFSIPLRDPGPQPNRIPMEKVKSMKARGLEDEEIAKLLGISIHRLEKIEKTTFTDDELNVLLWIKGLDVHDIAKMKGMSPKEVKNKIEASCQCRMYNSLEPEQRPRFLRDIYEGRQGPKRSIPEISKMFHIPEGPLRVSLEKNKRETRSDDVQEDDVKK